MGTLYDELAATPAPAAPAGGLYGSLVEQDTQQRTLRASLLATGNRTPEQAAQLNNLARVTGLPRPVVESAEGEAKARAQLQELWDQSADSPVLRARLLNPQFTELAKDDVGTLASIERGIQSAMRYTTGAGRGTLAADLKVGVFNRGAAASAGAFRAVAETLAVPFDFLEEFAAMGGNPLRRVAEGFSLIAKDNQRIIEREGGNVFGVSAGVQSLGQNAKYLPLAVAGPFGGVAALAGMTAESFGASYQKGREAGLSEIGSLIYGASDGAIEYATEKLPMSRLIGDVAVGTGVVKMLGRQLALEIPGEQIATVLQDMNEWAVINPQRTFRDYLADRPSAAAETLIATIVGTGGNVALAKTVDTALTGFVQEQLRQTDAGQQAVLFEQQLQAAMQSKLRERDPEQFREAVAAMTQATGNDTIYVDAAVLNQMPREVLAQLTGVEEQLADALATNGVVELKLADVLTVAPGTGLEQVLAQNMRAAPDALTAAEATQAGQEAQQLLAQQAQRVIDQAANAVQVQAAAEIVKTTILQELTATARFGAEANEAYATLVRDFYMVLGQRLGINAQQAFERYRLRVVAQTPAGALLDQDVPLRQGTPAFDDWFQDSKVVDEQGRPLVVYHGTRGDFSSFDGGAANSSSMTGVSDGVISFSSSAEAASSYAGRYDVQGWDSPENETKWQALWDANKHFEASRFMLEHYGTRRTVFEGPGQVMPVYVAMQNPLVVDAGGALWKEVPWRGDKVVAHDLVPYAKRQGHDGVIVRNVVDQAAGSKDAKPADTVFAFRPEQIKSAIGNRGTFDPDDPNILHQPAFHGSPHDFDKFSTDAIGTGEGAQAYGWGLYFAESRGVATNYRDALSSAEIVTVNGEPYDPKKIDHIVAISVETVYEEKGDPKEEAERNLRSAAELRTRGKDWANELADQQERVAKALQEGARFDVETRNHGRLYEVDIPDDVVARMLLWDKPLSEQPDAVKESLAPVLERWFGKGNAEYVINDAASPVTTGKDLVIALGHNKQASVMLDEAGIPGIKYLDGVSRPNANYKPVAPKYEAKLAKRQAEYDADPTQENASRLEDAKQELAEMRRADDENAGSYNLVVFNDKNVQLTHKDGSPVTAAERAEYFQDDNLAKVARGTFNPQTNVIALLQAADLSTFLHESGHFFLEVMADVASQPGAPADVQADMAALMRWFGVADLASWKAMTLEQQRPHHERFAESFEQYLLEGKAPNRELRPLFRKFRAFLTRVYRSMVVRPDLNLSDDVRKVMDRMLATDDQIAEAQQLAGMSLNTEATDEAVEKLQARSLRDLKWAVNARSKMIRKLQEQAKGLRKAVEDEVRAEVEDMPEVKAKAALDAMRKSTPEYKAALADWKARRQAVLDEAAATITESLLATEGAGLAGIQKGQFLAKNKRRIANEAEGRALAWERENRKPERQIVGQDVEVATVADAFGYPSVDAMLAAIDAFGRKEDAIEGMTDQRMIERHGDLADQRAIEQAATEAIHNEARARALATELAGQRDLLTNRKSTGEVDKAGRPVTVNATLEAARQFAADVASRKKVKDLKKAAWAHLQAERRAARAWEAATAKGDTQAAVQAKQDQLLNHEVYRALLEAQAQADKADAFFAKILKGSEEKLVERGLDPDVVMASRAILGAYELTPRGGQSPLEYLAKVEANDPEMYAVLRPAVESSLATAKPYPELTMGELNALVAELEAMQLLARRSRQMEVDGNLLDIEDAADLLKSRMTEIGVPSEMPGEASALTPKQERTRWLQFAKALMRRIEQWAEGMDGGRGPFTKLVFGPVKSAADRYRADRVMFRREYQKLLNNIAPALRQGPIVAGELGYTFGEGHNGIGHAELLHAILHTGNESNKRKLLLGRKWAVEQPDGTLDTSKWDGFVERMQREGYLAKEHYDFAQGVWDLLERTKPLAQKAHRDVFGRYFAEVTADAFDTPYGSYRGGYVPAQADPRIVTDAALRQLAEMENQNMAFSFPTTSKGFTKSRTEYNRPLILDLRTIGQHLDKVLLFSHMEPAVRDVNRLLRAKGVASSLSRIDPAAYEGALIPWLNRSARQQVETPIVGDGRISRVLSVARNRAGMSLMFANLSNTAQQITGFALAGVKVKPRLLLAASAQYIAGPKKLTDFVADTSIYMRDRMTNEVAAMHDAMEDILLDPSAYKRAQNWTQKHAYFMQSAVDNVMSPIVWTAAYNQALEAGQDEVEALKAADAAVRQTQGSTMPEDVSRIETGPAYARMFTQFLGYFNMVANTNGAELKKIASDVGLKKGAGKALYVVTLGLLIPAWVAQAIALAFRGGPEDEDDDGYLDDWLWQVFGMGTIKGTFAMVPFVGLGANALLARFNDNPTDDRVSLSPAVSLLEGAVGAPTSVYKAITDDGSWRTAVRDTASLIGMATGLPAVAAARPLGYLAGVAQEKIQPTSAADAVRGVATGAASPASK